MFFFLWNQMFISWSITHIFFKLNMKTMFSMIFEKRKKHIFLSFVSDGVSFFRDKNSSKEKNRRILFYSMRIVCIWLIV